MRDEKGDGDEILTDKKRDPKSKFSESDKEASVKRVRLKLTLNRD